MISNDTHIMSMLSGRHSHNHSWNRAEKQCNFIPISCICCQDYIATITVGIELKNGAISYHIMYMLLGLHSTIHGWNRTKKKCNFIPISCICHRDYIKPPSRLESDQKTSCNFIPISCNMPSGLHSHHHGWKSDQKTC